MVDRMTLRSVHVTQEQIARLRVLFPHCVTEARGVRGEVVLGVDFERLKQELSDVVIEGPQERYRLEWPGKREALLVANEPVTKTLRPCREESVAFDTTQNLFIEGDNLDVLKLLQESYLEKVKLVYIDPPYNTGKDFIYKDSFSDTVEGYKGKSFQKDDEGNRLVSNPETQGRFHSNWLSMMYPRLKLAKNLLSDEGVIFISIDDNEAHNLRKICDEIFGEDNFLCQITLLCNPKGRSQDKYIANCHEYIIGYSKKELSNGALDISKDENEISKNYKLEDDDGRYREIELRNTHREFGIHNRKNLYYPFYVFSDGSVSLDSSSGGEEVFPNWDDGFQGCWTWSKEKSSSEREKLVSKNVKGKWKIYRKNYAESSSGDAAKKLKSVWKDVWIEKEFYTEKGQSVFNEIFFSKYKLFQSPKSVELISQIVVMGSDPDSIILDFFAGSGTTAHAVMAQNAKDGGNRRFIQVQIPERTPEMSEACKAGYKTISELSRERIRRAGGRILEEGCHEGWKKDVGFRVLKLDSSTMEEVFYCPKEFQQTDLLHYISPIKKDRSDEDLLFHIMLDWGMTLTLPVMLKEYQDQGRARRVYHVDGNALLACFEKEISESLMQDLARLQPRRMVFWEESFFTDAARINVEQIFRQLSPATKLKVL